MLFVGLFLSPLVLAADEPRCPLPGYAYAWGDEFDGVKLDEERWELHAGQSGASMRSKDNVVLRGGQLVLLGRKAGGTSYLPYSSGEVSSRRLFRHGYYEVRYKVPEVPGWETRFLASVDQAYPKYRIDIATTDSLWPDRFRMQVERLSDRQFVDEREQDTPSLSKDFHAWGCEFTPEKIRFFFEGRLVAVTDTKSSQHGDLRVRLRMNLSWWSFDHLSGGHVATEEVAGHQVQAKVAVPSEACFDYVRVFVRN